MLQATTAHTPPSPVLQSSSREAAEKRATANAAACRPVEPPTTRSHYATGSARARLPCVFFALLDGWLPLELALELATEAVSVSIVGPSANMGEWRVSVG